VLNQTLDFILNPLLSTPWADWRGFWLGQVLADRLRVCWFLPLLPLLMLAPRRWLRPAIVVTGLGFIAWLFGVFYAAFWFGLCCLVHAAAERFARDVRTVRDARWPILGAWTVGVVGYFGSFYLQEVHLPDAWRLWIWDHARFFLPLGFRGVAWEADWRWMLGPKEGQPAPSLFFTVFLNPHNIGTAYLAVRMLHYFSELRHGTIAQGQRTLLNFLAYLCYAPNWMQGPIERYDTFQSEMDTCHERRGWHNALPALWRIGFGLGKAVVATLYLLPVLKAHFLPGNVGGTGGAKYFSEPELIQSYALLYFGVYIYIFALYLDFSGYCDVSAGMARLLGYRQVENFNLPWIATSLRDFWRRWHISLSTLLRDYIYIPLGGNRRYTTVNLCLTFAAIGVWHALMLQLLLWGVLMGLMLAANQRWVQWARRADETQRGALAALRRMANRIQPLPQLLAWALTMHFFVHSLLLFFGGGAVISVTWELLRRPISLLLG